MSTNNHVFQVLPTSGDEPVLGAGLGLDDLVVGQLGVFDDSSGLSIDGTVATRGIFFAVRVADEGETQIITSASQYIQTRNLTAYTFAPHSAAQNQKVLVKDLTVKCDSEYAIKLTFQNSQILRRIGNTAFTKTFRALSGCCGDCDSCAAGDCAEVIKGIVENVLSDKDGIVTAEAIATEALTVAAGGVVKAVGDPITLEELDLISAFNQAADDADKVCMGIEFEALPMKAAAFCKIPVKHHKFLTTTMEVSLTEGFTCSGTIEETQAAALEMGSGRVLAYKEFVAGGWNGRPGVYRTSATTGLGKESEMFVDPKVNYDQAMLAYDHFSVGGWLEYLNNMATIIAIPTTDATTLPSVMGVLDLIAVRQGFEELADDAALADADDTVVEPQPTSEETDGDAG